MSALAPAVAALAGAGARDPVALGARARGPGSRRSTSRCSAPPGWPSRCCTARRTSRRRCGSVDPGRRRRGGLRPRSPCGCPGALARRGLAVAAVAGVLAVAAGPAAYSVATAGRALNGNNVSAGPAERRPGRPGRRWAAAACAGGGGGRRSACARPRSPTSRPTRARRSTSSRPPARRPRRAIILATGKPVVTIGGFNGQDPAPTVSQLAAMVARGELRTCSSPAAAWAARRRLEFLGAQHLGQAARHRGHGRRGHRGHALRGAGMSAGLRSPGRLLREAALRYGVDAAHGGRAADGRSGGRAREDPRHLPGQGPAGDAVSDAAGRRPATGQRIPGRHAAAGRAVARRDVAVLIRRRYHRAINRVLEASTGRP